MVIGSTILVVAALIVFILAMFGVPENSKVNMVAFGLALWVASQVIVIMVK
jgi:hypothetical protein